MSTSALVSAVTRRLRKLVNIPTLENDVREMVVSICSDLEKVTAEVLDHGAEQHFSQQVLRLAYDLENVVEGQQYGEMSSIKEKIDVLKTHQPGSTTEYTTSGHDTFNPWVTPTHELIGLEDTTKDLVRTLIQGVPTGCVTIVGLAGIGKTALAHTVFSNKKIKEYFDGGLYWVSVNRNLRNGDVMLDVFHSTGGDDEHSQSSMTSKEFDVRIFKNLSGYFLIIFDDVWSVEIYDRLQSYFRPEFKFKNSRIKFGKTIITTRDERVATTIKGTSDIYLEVFKLGPLSDSATLHLFQQESRQSLPDYDKNELLQATVKSILNICRGIPMQIIEVARFFIGCPLQDWNMRLHEMLARETEERNIFLDVMGVSYQFLEARIKPCFLYLGQFPPDQPIRADKLCSMWMAEGLASTRHEAQSYLKRLIDMNLLISKREEESTGELISCQLQEMARRLSLLKGKSEVLFAVVDLKHGSERISAVVDRVAIHLNGRQRSDEHISSYIHDAERIRALLVFGDDSRWPEKFSELEKFQWTRVLEFDAIDFRDNAFPMSIDKLVYLRYLSIAGCYLEEFPLSCNNFPFMETLDLRVRAKMIIPNVLWKMSNLIHLFFPEEFQSKTGDKLKLEGLIKLETIENFHAGVCDSRDLLQFEHLKILKVTAHGENDDLKNLISNMDVSSRSHLRDKSSLVLIEFDSYSRERKETFKKLLECHGIHNLYLEGYIKWMPKDLNPATNFTEMVLDGTEFREDPMPILGKFENLRSLVLCNHAIRVEEISTMGSTFPKLQRFEMTNLPSLKNWVLDFRSNEARAMPELSVLTMKQCHNFSRLPENLLFTDLRMLVFGSMSQEFEESVRGMEKELRKRFWVLFKVLKL